MVFVTGHLIDLHKLPVATRENFNLIADPLEKLGGRLNDVNQFLGVG